MWKLDRLARDLMTQEAALGLVWRHGGLACTVDQSEIRADDPADPMRTAFRQMLGVFAQLERGMIRARMDAGRQAKDERGGYVGGAPKMGLRAEGHELVADPSRNLVPEGRRPGPSGRHVQPGSNITSTGQANIPSLARAHAVAPRWGRLLMDLLKATEAQVYSVPLEAFCLLGALFIANNRQQDAASMRSAPDAAPGSTPFQPVKPTSPLTLPMLLRAVPASRARRGLRWGTSTGPWSRRNGPSG